MSTSSSSNKNHPKKMGSSRERDKNKPIESGGSSQSETPPLAAEKLDAGPSQGRFAGISTDSVQCMADQIGVEINIEAATNLAEDVSYKLRQVISTIALHSEMMKKSRVDCWDVNMVLTLSDTSPVIGSSAAPYVGVGDEKLCCQYEKILNVTDIAMTTQTCVYTTPPNASVEWVTDDNSLSKNNNISIFLQNYYTKVARAILNLKKKPKEIAVEDLATNTRIGPIFPNLFNLAVLVLNDDNLNALNVPAKKPLQSNVLDMVDALCSNPCSLDTNIQQQFQRLFPVMVSNILGNGSLAEKMVAILTKITRTWPSFISIGKGTLFDYLSQGTKERLTAPMIKCVMALGRQALVECLGDHLDHIDDCIHAPRKNHRHTDLRETILDATSILLKPEATTYLEDYVVTDYTLYDMLGDSILPRRVIFPLAKKSTNGNTSNEKTAEEEFPYLSRPVTRRSRFRLITATKTNSCIHRDTLFEHSSDNLKRNVHIKIKGCRTKELPVRNRNIVMDSDQIINSYLNRTNSVVVVASGLLNRFRYRLSESRSPVPIYGALML